MLRAREEEEEKLTMPRLAQIESKLAEKGQKKSENLHATISRLNFKREMNANKMQLFKMNEEDKLEERRS